MTTARRTPITAGVTAPFAISRRPGRGRRRAAALATVLLVACATAPPADPTAVRREQAVTTALEIRNRLELPGLGFAVGAEGGITVAMGIGYADLEAKRLITPETVFRIGSVSKLLTATAAMRLAARGELDLDAPIGRWLPGLPEDKAALTPRQLLGHLAGVRHYRRDDYLSRTHYGDVADSLGAFIGDPLLAPPGSAYAYSSYGYNLLGAALQAAAGREFRRLIADEVLAPLAMAHTLAEDSAQPPRERVRLYSRGDDGALADAPAADLTDRWPSGGFLSTPADLVRFGLGVLRDDFLPAAAREAMLAPQHTADGTSTGVGLGWRVATDEAGRRYVHHGGEAFGGRAFLLVYPAEGVAVALLSNLTFARFGEQEARALAAVYLTATAAAPAGAR